MIPEIIKDLNRSIPLSKRNIPVPFKTFDFTKMYTNIELTDLKSCFKNLFEEVFTANKKYLLVHRENTNCGWSRVRKNNSHSLKCFSLEKLSQWLNFLVDNIYIRVGNDTVFRQQIGIPMGTNCAVYLANWYLFTYELKFVRKVIEAGRLDLLLAFKHSKRYIDDCFPINNPLF